MGSLKFSDLLLQTGRLPVICNDDSQSVSGPIDLACSLDSVKHHVVGFSTADNEDVDRGDMIGNHLKVRPRSAIAGETEDSAPDSLKDRAQLHVVVSGSHPGYIKRLTVLVHLANGEHLGWDGSCSCAEKAQVGHVVYPHRAA